MWTRMWRDRAYSWTSSSKTPRKWMQLFVLIWSYSAEDSAAYVGIEKGFIARNIDSFRALVFYERDMTCSLRREGGRSVLLCYSNPSPPFISYSPFNLFPLFSSPLSYLLQETWNIFIIFITINVNEKQTRLRHFLLLLLCEFSWLCSLSVSVSPSSSSSSIIYRLGGDKSGRGCWGGLVRGVAGDV